MRALLLLAALTLGLAGLAHAQAPAPADGDFDTSPPADDVNFTASADGTADAAPADPAPGSDVNLTDSDLDTSVPPVDTSYENDSGIPPAVQDAAPSAGAGGSTGGTPAAPAPAGGARTPGLDAPVVVLGLAAAVLVARRRA
jgi:hypothetical protein